MIYFTICSRNFISSALTLHASLRRHQPDVSFYIVLCDEPGDLSLAALPCPVVTLRELPIPRLADMIERYNITELNTSLKPFAFLYLFAAHPGEAVVYMDPDIYVVSPMVELNALLGPEAADCVLTPHVTEPSEYTYMDDFKFLTHGIYNLGFCALRDTHEVRRIVAWWGRRLEKYCTIDLANGIFVDQKWVDFFPSFIAKTSVLRHPGYNIAYWNLSQRRLEWRQEWIVNEEPLRFVHFSGSSVDKTTTFSRHSNEFTVATFPELGALLAEYREELFRNGQRYYASFPYAFSWLGASGRNAHAPEALMRAPGTNAIRPHLPVSRYRSPEDFAADRRLNAAPIASRAALEAALMAESGPVSLDGFCSACDTPSRFTLDAPDADRTPGGGSRPAWHDHLACVACGLPNGSRAALHVLQQEFGPSTFRSVYVTEKATPLFGHLEAWWPGLVGGSSLDPDLGQGEPPPLAFPDGSFDLVLGLDGVAPGPFTEQGLPEIARILSAGGRLFFTGPFAPEPSGRHAGAAGSDVPGSGPFGWTILRRLDAAGFEDAEVLSFWSSDLVNLGDPQFAITARRASGPAAPALAP